MGQKNKLTNSTKEQFQIYISEGKSLSEIGAIYGAGKASVHTKMKKLGLSLHATWLENVTFFIFHPIEI